MTTIAWDGRTLAADRCSWSGGCRRSVRKVFKVTAPDGRRYLVAFAGYGNFCLTVLAWMRGRGARPEPREYFEAKDLNQQCAVVIDGKGRVWSLGNELVYCRMQERMFATGAGQEFAWGALEAGATAKRAVQIAAKRSDYAGFGVDTVRF